MDKRWVPGQYTMVYVVEELDCLICNGNWVPAMLFAVVTLVVPILIVLFLSTKSRRTVAPERRIDRRSTN